MNGHDLNVFLKLVVRDAHRPDLSSILYLSNSDHPFLLAVVVSLCGMQVYVSGNVRGSMPVAEPNSQVLRILDSLIGHRP